MGLAVKKIQNLLKKVDDSLGNPSHLGSSVPEKRIAAEERFGVRDKKDAAADEWDKDLLDTISISEKQEQTEKTLREQLTDYVDNHANDEDTIRIITETLADNPNLSDPDLALVILAHENGEIHELLVPWILNHSREDVTIDALRLSAKLHVEGIDQIPGDNVQDIAATLFELHNNALDSTLAACLLIGDSADL
jgi:hypothetical protein